MIAITAATGNVGRQLSALLTSAAAPTRLLVRDTAAIPTSSATTQVQAADLDDAASMTTALTGISHLFLLSPGPDTPAQDAIAIAAATRTGVQHVVLLSSLGIEAGGIGGGRAHTPGEQLLKDTTMDWTILRPSEFMTNTLAWISEATSNGTISVPTGHGKVAMIAPADIAAAASTVLTTAGHIGRTYRLTGPESLSTDDIAERFTHILGRPVTHQETTVATFRRTAAQAGLPPAMIDTLADYYPALAQGAMDIRTADLEQLIGRPGTPYLEFLHTALPTQPTPTNS